jgi:hypothetical protein
MTPRADLPATLEDVVEASLAVARAARGGADPLAAAWLVRNRARAALAARRAGAPAPGFGDGSLAAAARSLARDLGAGGAQPSARRSFAAAAAVCRMLAGGAEDPTGGAVAPGVLREGVS